jgi:hypothetical protein
VHGGNLSPDACQLLSNAFGIQESSRQGFLLFRMLFTFNFEYVNLPGWLSEVRMERDVTMEAHELKSKILLAISGDPEASGADAAR